MHVKTRDYKDLKNSYILSKHPETIHICSHDAFRVLAVEVQLLVQYEALQSGRENMRVHDFRVVEFLQCQTPPDLQSAEVSEGARTVWRARSKKNYFIISYCNERQIKMCRLCAGKRQN